MITDKCGIVSATKTELLEAYIGDNDLYNIMAFGHWVYWLMFQGVKVNA